MAISKNEIHLPIYSEEVSRELKIVRFFNRVEGYIDQNLIAGKRELAIRDFPKPDKDIKMTIVEAEEIFDNILNRYREKNWKVAILTVDEFAEKHTYESQFKTKKIVRFE